MNNQIQKLINERKANLNYIQSQLLLDEFLTNPFFFVEGESYKEAVKDNEETDRLLKEYETKSYVSYCINNELPF